MVMVVCVGEGGGDKSLYLQSLVKTVGKSKCCSVVGRTEDVMAVGMEISTGPPVYHLYWKHVCTNRPVNIYTFTLHINVVQIECTFF